MPPARRAPSSQRRGWAALTGTPGVGKSSVALRLPARFHPVEVRDLALRLGAGRLRAHGSVEVDLPRLRRAFRSYSRGVAPGVVVGHLAHLLPVEYIVILRCHPSELARRLRKAGRSRRDQTGNALVEELDVVLIESLEAEVPVREVDTTHRSISEVARQVASILRRRPPARFGRTRWLAERRGTEELLRVAR